MGEAERRLVAAAQAGDPTALDQLLREHYDRIHGLCRRICGHDADAQDATQEALLAIVRGLPRFDGRAAFGTWSYRIATNACFDELRRRRRRPEPGLPDLDRTDTGGDGPPLDTAVADQVVVDTALAALPAEFRAAVVLRDLCRLDYAEISDVLGIPPGTVRSRIARGRAALARELGEPAPPTERPRTPT
jgi:RNA polymerase sigma-70 factor, ECF subfamily